MTAGADGGAGVESEPCCKVARSGQTYGVSEVDAELRRRREGGASYRELSAWFNARLVARALERAGVDAERSVPTALLGDELAERTYRVLRGEEGSDVQRAETRARMADAGVDVDALEAAFVSHVTLRSHLRDCLEVADDGRTPASVEDAAGVIRWARNRTRGVASDALARLRRDGAVAAGELDVEVLVTVTCRDCGASYHLREFLDRERCDCGGRDT
ncbi:hypothetical protein BRC94_07405 [Halobacteriales archaeon QS_5_70_17]|nr:MAG: hypothetical protein BRC94_07405 [Halobacteriales archaeon QS_5_70_17]